MSKSQKAAYESLAESATSPEARKRLLNDLISHSAEHDLKWIDDTIEARKQLVDYTLKKQARANSRGPNLPAPARSWKDYLLGSSPPEEIKTYNGLYQRSNTHKYSPGESGFVPAKIIIGDAGVGARGVGVHESTHVFSDMAGHGGVSKQAGMINPDMSFNPKISDTKETKAFSASRDAFFEEYKEITKGITGYSAEDLRLEKAHELLPVLQQARVDPRTREAFKSSPNAQAVLTYLMQQHGYNKGGIVYAANGALMAAQSRGTDTVPAMLTPGEFVVNREASQKHAPILQAINSGHYDHGGMVNYLNNGGIATTKYFSRGDVVTEDLEKLNEKRRNNGGVSNNGGSGGGISDQLDSLEKRFQSFDNSIASLGDHMGKLETTVGSFGEHSASMSDSVSRFSIAANTKPQPRENIISGNLVTSLDVKHHGLGQMAPALENMILTNSNDQLNQLNRLQEGSLFPGDANATIGKNQQGYA